MSKKTAKRGEAAQYEPLERFLQEHYGCTKTWRVGKKPRIKLHGPSRHFGTPDVVGARPVSDGWEVWLVEAKHDAGRHSLMVGVGQLEAVRPWADYLVLSVASDEWSALTKDGQAEIRSRLEAFGAGLLLVMDDDVRVCLEPRPNSKVDEALHEDILDQMDVPKDHLAVELIGILSSEQARVAAHTVAITYQFLEEASAVWQQEFTGWKPRGEWINPAVTLDDDYPSSLLVTTMSTDGGRLYVEGDPFGEYRSYGPPAVWLWFDLPGKKISEALISMCCAGCYVFADGVDDAEWFPLDDFDQADAARRGHTATLSLGFPVSIVDRTPAGFRREFSRLIRLVRSKEFKAAAGI